MSTLPDLRLVSHDLCPYVQRVIITLSEKDAPFVRTYIDLSNKPDWFKEISPLGKVPLLQVDGEILFESAVICDYIDETIGPHLHPRDPMERARHRSWIEFGSAILNSISAFYNAPDAHCLERARNEMQDRFRFIEDALGEGPYFSGKNFSLVDAAFGPVFRYFDVFDKIEDFDVLIRTPKVRGWRDALAARRSVKDAVNADYPARLMHFLEARASELSRRIALL